MNKTRISLSATYLFAFTLLWLAVAMPAAAATDVVAAITFNPPLTDPNSLQAGDFFTATVNLSSASNQVVDTVGLYMTFDQAKVQVHSATDLNLDLCLPPLSYDNGSGTITGDCAKLGGAPANFDVLEIVFEVVVTDTRFDLAFVECATPDSVNCFSAYSGAANQITTYNSAFDSPLTITLQTMRITNNVAVELGIVIILATLVLITAVIILSHKRQHGNGQISQDYPSR